MLSLCLTLSVLMRLQVAGTRADQRVVEACKCMMCYPVGTVNVYDGSTFENYQGWMNYEELTLTNLQWLYTFVNGTDLKTATKIALDRFFEYSHFNNAAGTIVPISAAWAMYAPFVDGRIKQEFSFFIALPLQVESPPDSNDPSVSVAFHPQRSGYVMTLEQKTEDYERLANEFKKDLEKDHQSFLSHYVYIAWYNTRGLVQIVFVTK